ncbi:MAG TPA: hypothetical protein VED18_06240 [Candidatus Sulfotelmatobacter sp.]|nr:hypothetical protein [Candidatus Sulfotelmatobacter sp.]
MRYLMLIIAAGFLTGCAADVVMVNPRTGETAICRESLQGLNPWSQKEACVGDYITRGWTRASPD